MVNCLRHDSVKVPQIEKIGLVEWFEVRTHARGLYVPLSTLDAHIHDFQMGDYLRIKIDAIKRGPRE